MAYQKQTWYDLPAETTPINANRLNHIEDGIEGAETLANGLVPVGTVLQFAGSNVPTGWAICDGSLLNRADYAELFSAIGTSYNQSGDASTKFRIPDLKGRVIVGVNGSDTDLDTIGKSGGEKEHTLTVAEMPAHTHRNPLGKLDDGNLSGVNNQKVVADSENSTGYNSYQTTSTGGGTAHNIMQPYLVMNYIIRIQ